MNLNWFSPVPPTQSSIAEVTATVLPALSKKVSITAWVYEERWSPDLDQFVRVRRYHPNNPPWADINAAEMSIFHFGNHPYYHGPIWQVNRGHPGIVVLHDLTLQHFFAYLACHELGLRPREYCEMMQFYHPDGGREAAMDIISGRRTAHQICERYPLTNAALENALGVAVHNQAGCSAIQDSTNLPLAYVPLIPTEADSELELAVDPRRRHMNADGIYRIIMFGFLGPNRRVTSVLQSLRDFPQRDRFRLDIFGTLENKKNVCQLIADFRLENMVTIHGFVPEADLRSALAQSDLAINLRHPTMGEASGSQLQIWRHSLPSLVSDTGWYATLPRDTVAVVRRAAEVEDIHYHLDRFLRMPDLYRQLGRQGHCYLHRHHNIDNYVDSLLSLVETTLRDRLGQGASWMAHRTGRTIRPWFDERAAGLLLPDVADAILSLFGETKTRRHR
jgi:glycosyltransferase involved in cell wall biosynthesis